MTTLQNYFSALDPAVLEALIEVAKSESVKSDINVNHLADLVAEKLNLGNESYVDSREKSAQTGKITVVQDIFNLGMARGAGRYAYVYQVLRKRPGKDKKTPSNVYTEDDDAFQKLTEMQNRFGFESIRHKCWLIKSIRRLVESQSVHKFMIGKTSSPKHQHIHKGMVNRFGNKYSPHGYHSMFGLCMLDYETDDSAEFQVITIEGYLHTLFSAMYPDKFDSELSNSQSGNLTKNKKTYIVLYIALRQLPRVINAEEDEDSD